MGPKKKRRAPAPRLEVEPRRPRGRAKALGEFVSRSYAASNPRDWAASRPEASRSSLLDHDQPFTETKKVRLGHLAAKWLEETARREDKTESDILREGLLLAERVRARQAALEGMLEFVDDAPGKETFELR